MSIGEQVITHAHDDNMLGVVLSYMIFIDVDECQTDNGGCNQTCTNTQGSYVCSCIGQYTLDDDQHGCIGIVHDNNIQEFGFFFIFCDDLFRTGANCSHFCWQWCRKFLH